MVTTRIIPSKPALMLDGNAKSLIITDLHIGFEATLASNDIFIGKNTSTNETIAEVLEIIQKTKPDSLILLGDVKSSVKSISKNEWNEVPMFLNKIKEKVDVVLVPGNHDSNIQKLVPEGINLVSSSGLVIENSLLTHGHTMPSENFSHVEKIILGHVHPVFFQDDSVLHGQRVWVSIKTEKSRIFPSSSGELEIIVIPSFNKYLYATHKKQYKKSISPIIERVKENSSARIATLDGAMIGNEAMIDQVL